VLASALGCVGFSEHAAKAINPAKARPAVGQLRFFMSFISISPSCREEPDGSLRSPIAALLREFAFTRPVPGFMGADASASKNNTISTRFL
jgi:hypothetical protein